VESFGTSLGNLDIPILKISNKNSDTGSFEDKPIIIVIGRQHPGETHSSFIIHGFLNFILSKALLPHKFRELYETWVIPIVNPDGVVCGNYRNTLQGKDMNRHFFADDDPEGYRNRSFEVEIIRQYIK
jgi:murein tripeptide amidase MpaA